MLRKHIRILSGFFYVKIRYFRHVLQRIDGITKNFLKKKLSKLNKILEICMEI